MSQLNCPKCSLPIPQSNIDPVLGTARCPACADAWEIESCKLPEERSPLTDPLASEPPDGCWASDQEDTIVLVASYWRVGQVYLAIRGRAVEVRSGFALFGRRRRFTDVDPRCVRIVAESNEGCEVLLIAIEPGRTYRFGSELGVHQRRWLAGALIEALTRGTPRC